MNKPRNEDITIAVEYGTQLRYVSKRRLRKLRAKAKRRHELLNFRRSSPWFPFCSWLRPV